MMIFEQKELQAAKMHEYEDDGSPSISRALFGRLWSAFSHLFPTWLDPKVILVPAMVLEIATFLLSYVYSYYMTRKLPTLICVMNGLFSFIYVFLKGSAGKQARRSDIYPALHIYFERSCDLVAAILETMKFCMVLKLGVATRSMYLVSFITICYLIAYLEEKCSSRFYIQRWFGSDETISVLGIFQILCGVSPVFNAICGGDFILFTFLGGFTITMLVYIYRFTILFYNDRKHLLHFVSALAQFSVCFISCGLNEVLTIDRFISPFFVLLPGLMIIFQAQLENIATIVDNVSTVYYTVFLVEVGISYIPMIPSFRNDPMFWEFYFWAHVAVIFVTNSRVIYGLSTGLDVPILSTKRMRMAMSSSADLRAEGADLTDVPLAEQEQ